MRNDGHDCADGRTLLSIKIKKKEQVISEVSTAAPQC